MVMTVSGTQGKPLLLVGWHGKAMEIFRNRGQSIVCAIDPHDRAEADHLGLLDSCVTVVDTSSPEAVLAGLYQRQMSLRDFAGVWSALEMGLVAASMLAALSGRTGMPLATAVALRDKYTQKAAVRAVGIPVTGCQVVDDLIHVASICDGRRLVVKPLSGAAARDTFLVEDGDTVVALAEALPAEKHGPWLVEEYVDGPEMHFDGVVREGQLTLLSVSQYLQNVITIRDGGLVGSVTLDPDADRAIYEQAADLTSRALAALGHTDGVFHLEAFRTTEGLVFSECAGRIGGGLVRDAVLRKFGINLVEAWIDVIDGTESAPARVAASSYGWIHLPAPSGRLLSVPDEAELLRLPGCTLARIDVGVGYNMPVMSLGSDVRAARVLVSGESRTEVEWRMLKIAEWFSSQVRIAPPETRD